MIFFLSVSLTDRHASKNCKGCKEVSESQRNETSEKPCLRDMVKRSTGKKQQEETERQQHVIVTENNLFKGFIIEDV